MLKPYASLQICNLDSHERARVYSNTLNLAGKVAQAGGNRFIYSVKHRFSKTFLVILAAALKIGTVINNCQLAKS